MPVFSDRGCFCFPSAFFGFGRAAIILCQVTAAAIPHRWTPASASRLSWRLASARGWRQRKRGVIFVVVGGFGHGCSTVPTYHTTTTRYSSYVNVNESYLLRGIGSREVVNFITRCRMIQVGEGLPRCSFLARKRRG